MEKTWVIAERQNSTFRIVKLINAEQEPTEEYKKAVVEVIEFYKDKKIPNSTVCIFMPFDDECSKLLAEASSDNLLSVFESLKSAGRTSCNDVVSIERAAWCHQSNIDILEYSLQNGGGGKTKIEKLKKNKEYQAFLRSRCEVGETTTEQDDGQETIEVLAKEVCETICYLYERWQDEMEYEDFADYEKKMKEVAEKTKGVQFTKGTKRPFGFQFSIGKTKYAYIVKAKGNRLALSVKQLS